MGDEIMKSRRDGTYDVIRAGTREVVASGLSWVDACDYVADHGESSGFYSGGTLEYLYHDADRTLAHVVDTRDDVSSLSDSIEY
jgi:hypothetical protein